VALKNICIKNAIFKIFKITAGCQYVGYFYKSENITGPRKTFDWAACGPRLDIAALNTSVDQASEISYRQIPTTSVDIILHAWLLWSYTTNHNESVGAAVGSHRNALKIGKHLQPNPHLNGWTQIENVFSTFQILFWTCFHQSSQNHKTMSTAKWKKTWDHLVTSSQCWRICINHRQITAVKSGSFLKMKTNLGKKCNLLKQYKAPHF